MKKRETELDILRIIALLAVIFTHTCGICPNFPPLKTFVLATITWHVPVFVMISGRFFLDPDRELPVSKLIKAITHLVLAFAFWSLVYQIFSIAAGTYPDRSWRGVISAFLIGPYHFWYLTMLICLYAIIPFLRKITESKALMEYFISLFLLFGFITLYGSNLPVIGTTIACIESSTNFHLALGYSGYYILGFYLRRYPLQGRRELGLYVLGICMFLFTGLATVWKTAQGAPGNEWFSKYLMPNVVIEAAAVYTFFINRIGRIRFPEKLTALITKLAEYSFGAYLLHVLVYRLLLAPCIRRASLPPIVTITLTLFLTYVISTGLTILIRKIPCVGKKIT